LTGSTSRASGDPRVVEGRTDIAVQDVKEDALCALFVDRRVAAKTGRKDASPWMAEELHDEVVRRLCIVITISS
jgi:hypothetical protein